MRLDDEFLKALARLETTGGLSRSEAIRVAVVDSAARLCNKKSLRAESRALDRDEKDRREMLAVAAMMESLRAPR